MGPAASGIEEDGAATTGQWQVFSASRSLASWRINRGKTELAAHSAQQAPRWWMPSVVSARRRLATARASLVHLPLPLNVLRRRC